MFDKITSRLFGSKPEQKSYSVSTISGWPEEFFSAPTAAGANVTASTALRNSAVLQAVRLISENVGSTPVKLYRRAGDGKEVAKDHPAYRIVHGRANEWTSAAELRTAVTLDALTRGHGFALVSRYSDGRPFELLQLDPSTVQVKQDAATVPPVYIVSDVNGGLREYSYQDVLHVSAFAGVSPVALAKEAIGTAIVLERHAAQLFGSGARPSAILTKEGKAGAGPDGGATTLSNMRKAWNATFGPGKSGAPLFLDDGWTYQAATMTSTDAEFLANRQFQVAEIARAFGVPPTMLFELGRATWSNAEQMFDTFLALALRPWLDRWQAAYDRCLLSEDERDDYFSEFVVDDLQRADTAARTDAFGKLVAMRAMTPNEVRATMNMPPHPDGDQLSNPYTSTAPVTAPKDKPE